MSKQLAVLRRSKRGHTTEYPLGVGVGGGGSGNYPPFPSPHNKLVIGLTRTY